MTENKKKYDKYSILNQLLLVVVIVGGVILMSMVFMRFNSKVTPDNLGEIKSVELEKELSEISGLAYSENLGLLAVNDEKGKIYQLDKKNGKIQKKYSFSKPGDFEGIAVVGKHIYAVDSSGDLFRFNTKSEKTKKIETHLKHKNDIEGLCYNPADSSLLIAAKGQSLPDKNKKSFSSIFRYDLKKGKVNKDVFLKIDIDKIEDELRKKITDGFGTSGIAVHNDNFFLISHHSKALLVYDLDKKLVKAYNLDPSIYNQPEGITFINGKLVISNEKGSYKTSTLAFHKKFRL